MKHYLIAATAALLSILPLRVHAAGIEPTDLGRVVRLAVADASEALTETDVVLPGQDGEIRIMADSGALRAGLAALIEQSAKAMRRSSSRRMDIVVSHALDRVILELSDAGPGMSVRDIAAMYGGNSGRSSARRGIERGGGVINVLSHAGAGTVYSIEFRTPAEPASVAAR